MFLQRLYNWSTIGQITIILLMLLPKGNNDPLLVNLAPGKRTYLSSRVGNHYGGYAVDRRPKGNYTLADDGKGDPWFVVDLGRPYRIRRINLFNRTECAGCDKYEFVTGLLNNFDPKSKQNWRNLNIECPQGFTMKSLVFECDSTTDYFRYVIVQPKSGTNVVMMYELEVYGINLDYHGCYGEIVDAFDTVAHIQSLPLCLDKCLTKPEEYIYAVLKEDDCWCTSIIKKIVPMNECKIQCADKVDYCGGPTAYSVYKIQNKTSKYIELNHHCKGNDTLNVDGVCEKGECEQGWNGDSCSMRDCSVHNGACENQQCSKVQMPSGTTGECVCSTGYVRSVWWENCRDVDECEEELMCNELIASCTNQPGGYTCDCVEKALKYNYTDHTCYVPQTSDGGSYMFFYLIAGIVGILVTGLLISIVVILYIKFPPLKIVSELGSNLGVT